MWYHIVSKQVQKCKLQQLQLTFYKTHTFMQKLSHKKVQLTFYKTQTLHGKMMSIICDVSCRSFKQKLSNKNWILLKILLSFHIEKEHFLLSFRSTHHRHNLYEQNYLVRVLSMQINRWQEACLRRMSLEKGKKCQFSGTVKEKWPFHTILKSTRKGSTARMLEKGGKSQVHIL